MKLSEQTHSHAAL